MNGNTIGRLRGNRNFWSQGSFGSRMNGNDDFAADHFSIALSRKVPSGAA